MGNLMKNFSAIKPKPKHNTDELDAPRFVVLPQIVAPGLDAPVQEIVPRAKFYEIDCAPAKMTMSTIRNVVKTDIAAIKNTLSKAEMSEIKHDDELVNNKPKCSESIKTQLVLKNLPRREDYPKASDEDFNLLVKIHKDYPLAFQEEEKKEEEEEAIMHNADKQTQDLINSQIGAFIGDEVKEHGQRAREKANCLFSENLDRLSSVIDNDAVGENPPSKSEENFWYNENWD